MSKKLTTEIITKICDLYVNGISSTEIAKQLNIGRTTVLRYLEINNIKIKPRGGNFKFDSIQKEFICQDYLSGLSEEKLAKKYDSNRTTIRNVLKEYDVKIRDNSEYKIYTIDENYFDEIDTSNKAYILGFLYADGNVGKDNYVIQLGLQERDRHILEIIKHELNTDRPLYYDGRNGKNKNHQNIFSLSIKNKHMHNTLMKYGVIPQKTQVVTYPNFLRKDLHRHFLRGVMDGDGCIHAPSGKNGKIKSVDICGTKIFCEEAKKIIEKELGVHCSVIKTSTDLDRKTYRITISGGIQVPKFLNWLYEESDLKLDRKYQTYLKYYCNDKLA